jgi:hypothetical protein
VIGVSASTTHRAQASWSAGGRLLATTLGAYDFSATVGQQPPFIPGSSTRWYLVERIAELGRTDLGAEEQGRRRRHNVSPRRADGRHPMGSIRSKPTVVAADGVNSSLHVARLPSTPNAATIAGASPTCARALRLNER